MIRVFLLMIFCVVLYCDGKIATEKNVNKLTTSSTIVDDPDKYRNVSELISSKGYTVEEYIVQTADGYLLSVQRVPHGRNNTVDEGEKQVVLLIHGIMCDASVWVLNLPGQSLGFVLPDAGFDTWFLNTRGVPYSRKHLNLTTNQLKFWDFSFDEVAQYDIPATIDYILEVTGKKALYVIANSQGSSAVFAMLSEMPDYNDKVKLFIALAPVAFVWHSTSGITSLVPFAEEIILFSNLLYSGELLPNTGILNKLKERFCQTTVNDLCKNLYYKVTGDGKTNYNQTRLGVYLAHHPVSTSVKSLHQYAQMFESKKFRKYDYGSKNFEHYNQEEPPDYELSHITAPVALIWSKSDLMADWEDIDILRKQLKSLVFDYPVPFDYNHADFFIAQNSPKMVNEPVLQLLTQPEL